jgi:hypothetical protein
MKEMDLFNCLRLPARLTIEQVAQLLGFQVYEILILVRLGKLKCVSHPGRNSRKFFHCQYVMKLGEDGDFIEKSTKVIAKVVRENNRKMTKPESETMSA